MQYKYSFLVYDINLGFGMRYKSRFWQTISIWLFEYDINLGFGIRYKSRYSYMV
jgi:hypothetical protein